MHMDICVCICFLSSPSGGQWGDGGPLRRDATDLHVGERAPSLAAAVRDRGGRGDDVLQPVEGYDEERQQEYQQAKEEPHVNINIARASWWWGGCRRGGRGWGETEEGPIVYWRDCSLIVVHQRDIHPWHLGWRSVLKRQKQKFKWPVEILSCLLELAGILFLPPGHLNMAQLTSTCLESIQSPLAEIKERTLLQHRSKASNIM